MTTLKGLPSTYDKDLQEDKVPLFYAYDTLMTALPVMAGAIRTLTIHPERMRASIDPSMMATDLADYLVLKGMAFREAHELAGRLVQLDVEEGKALDALELDDYQSLSPVFEADVLDVFDPEESISRRNVLGGTGLEAVQAQLQQAKKLLEEPQKV
jgi:argininosuccinate lyase